MTVLWRCKVLYFGQYTICSITSLFISQILFNRFLYNTIIYYIILLKTSLHTDNKVIHVLSNVYNISDFTKSGKEQLIFLSNFSLSTILSNVVCWSSLKRVVCIRETVPLFPHMTYLQESWKHSGKRKNCSSGAISAFTTVFSKVVCKKESVDLLLTLLQISGYTCIHVFQHNCSLVCSYTDLDNSVQSRIRKQGGNCPISDSKKKGDILLENWFD